jgi:hypothetical protein
MKQISKALAIVFVMQIHAAFAQEIEDEQPESESQPQIAQKEQQPEEEPELPVPNTITVDFGPTIIGAAISSIGSRISDVDGINTSGFGIALQYERQIIDIFSVAGRIAYLRGGIVYKSGDAKVDLTLSSWSLETHPRVYPFAGSLFLDGMFGYANMSTSLKGEVKTKDNPKEGAKFTVSKSFLKYGAKFGWRVDFGEPGGLIFEHSYGYFNCVGFGDNFVKRIQKKVEGEMVDTAKFNDMFSILENWLFIGGVRASLALGWRF